ncbi:MAG: relaxase/mobilization nuclease domain-containing protein [Beijerinckiaceae bacterium]
MKYLTSAEKGLTPEHIEARNIVNVDRAANEMRAVAGLSKRIKKPVYHLILAWSADESPSRQQQREAARRLLDMIGLGSHQAVIVVHDEAKDGVVPGEGGRHHETHVCLNRVRFDGSVAKLNHDFAQVEIATSRIASEMGFRRVAGRFNGEGGALAQPGVGDTIGSMRAESGRKTLADEIRDDPGRFEALRAERKKGWPSLIAEFGKQGIELVRGPPPRRHDLQHGIVMQDVNEPSRRIKISALDSPAEKWGAGALVRELGRMPPECASIAGPDRQSAVGRTAQRSENRPQSLSATNQDLYARFVGEKEAALALRAAVLAGHKAERTILIERQRGERSSLYANARRRRQILYDLFGGRSLTRLALNAYFDWRLNERRAEVTKCYDELWQELRCRHATERIEVPRWVEWQRSHNCRQSAGHNVAKVQVAAAAAASHDAAPTFSDTIRIKRQHSVGVLGPGNPRINGRDGGGRGR